jgi:hypothetical protein
MCRSFSWFRSGSRVPHPDEVRVGMQNLNPGIIRALPPFREIRDKDGAPRICANRWKNRSFAALRMTTLWGS